MIVIHFYDATHFQHKSLKELIELYKQKGKYLLNLELTTIRAFFMSHDWPQTY
jgi:hypothetical protein